MQWHVKCLGKQNTPHAPTLETELQTKLNRAASTGADDRIGGGNVRRGTGATESTWRGWIIVSPAVLAAEWIGEIWMVKEVEEFSPELHLDAFSKTEILHDGEIDIPEAQVAKHVAAHIAESADCRG